MYQYFLRSSRMRITAQVTDIADAMVLRRLLETLLDEGVVMVVTSKYVLCSLSRQPAELMS